VAECGLAALGSLMSVYGADVPLDRLRNLAASTLYGTSLRTLREIAIRVGFEAKARRVEVIADLAAHVPCLVHLNFIHFAVVERVTASEILVSDPLVGPARMPIDRFSRAFTGIVLTLKPTKFLRRVRPAPRASRRLLLAGRGIPLAGAAAAGSGVALASAALLAGARIDGQGGAALPLLALAIAALFAEAAARLSADAVAAVAGAEMTASIDHVADQPAAAFVLRSPFQANALLNAPAALIDPLLIDAGLAAVTAVAMLIGALVAGPVLGLAGTIAIGAEAAALAATVLRRGKAVPHLRWQAMPVRTPYPDQLLRADGWGLGRGGETLFQGLAGSHASAAAAAMPGAERGAALAGLRAGFAGLRLLVLLLVGGALLRNGAQVGSLFASGALVMLTGSQLGRIAAGLRTPGVTAALHRLADRSETMWGERPRDPPVGTALILDNVAWRPAEMLPDAISGVSFSIPTAGSLAIIAPPRSGATTIARLASGWLSPTKGIVSAAPAILLGAHWIYGGGRLRDLFTMGNPVPDAAMLDMVDALGLTRALASRGGLDIRLSAGAPELSGGQRRRLMLGAALLRNPALLVLDGTLEAVGTESAAALLELCRARGTAVLLAGHRDDLAALCDSRYDHAARSS